MPSRSLPKTAPASATVSMLKPSASVNATPLLVVSTASVSTSLARFSVTASPASTPSAAAVIVPVPDWPTVLAPLIRTIPAPALTALSMSSAALVTNDTSPPPAVVSVPWRSIAPSESTLMPPVPAESLHSTTAAVPASPPSTPVWIVMPPAPDVWISRAAACVLPVRSIPVEPSRLAFRVRSVRLLPAAITIMPSASAPTV